MKKIIGTILIVASFLASFGQQDNEQTYKKKVLDNTEVNFLYSYYKQVGNHASVLGGEGSEKLNDNTPVVIINLPLNEDDVLTIDFGVDIYTSASSSFIDPFDRKGGVNLEDDVNLSGESSSDNRLHVNFAYSHSSDNRNITWGANTSISQEYDYYSFGFGGLLSRQLNNKNTEVSLRANVFLDSWKVLYPVEFRKEFNLPPSQGFELLPTDKRNSISTSLSLSQIFTQRLQASFMIDLISQSGLLSTNFQRVYFANEPKIIIGGFELAHDIERLPDTRIKIPLGVRLNYYLNDLMVIRTYYRYYWDDWGIAAHTASLEIPFKISPTFTFSPTLRYYTQTESDYFAPKQVHLSAEEFYTSDYDLSEFNSFQYGAGLRISPPLGIFKFDIPLMKGASRLKSFNLRYIHYDRSDGLKADIFSFGVDFII